MLQPFPFPISIGTDICAINRIATIINGRTAPTFIRRLLTAQEQEENQEKLDIPTAQLQHIERQRALLRVKQQKLGVTNVQLSERRRRVLQTADSTNDGSSSSGAEAVQVRRVDDLDILNHLSREINREEKSVNHAFKRTATFLAGRFAAKEAVIKAYRWRRLTYHDIWIQNQLPRRGMAQAPVAVVVSARGGWEDGQIVPLSISHDGEYATAVCMACEGGRGIGGGVETAREAAAAPQEVREGE